jgi:hypothetical protein
MPQNNIDNQSYVISYLTLRKIVGILGIVFPVVLVIGTLIIGEDSVFQRSISMYYHTHMRDVFVGILCAIALFFFAYRGYDTLDNITGDFAGLFALGLTFCPISDSLVGMLHLAFAILFFFTLAFFSFFLFTKGSQTPSSQKLKRNRLYRICGIIIFCCLVLLIVVYLLPSNVKDSGIKPLFWLETIGLWAFGLSWLVKGEFLLKDE